MTAKASIVFCACVGASGSHGDREGSPEGSDGTDAG